MGQDHDPKIANSELLLTLTAMMQVIGDKNLAEIIEELNIGIDLANLPADDFSLTFPARNYARLVSKIESTYSGGGIRILSRIAGQ